MYTDEFEEKYKIPAIILAVMFLIAYPVWVSWDKWKAHPKTLNCKYSDNTCNLTTYYYEHTICWDVLLSSRHSSSTRNRCRLPKIVESKTQLIPLSDFSDYEVKKVGKDYKVYIKDKNGVSNYIAKFKNRNEATQIGSNLKRHITKWNETPPADNEETDTDYSYKFIEYDY